MTVETTTTRTVSGKPAAQRAAEAARIRKLPRSYWDPEYYADPRNAAMARSILDPVSNTPMTEHQFYRMHIVGQASMYGEQMVRAFDEVLAASPTVTPGLATGLATLMRNMQVPQAIMDDLLTVDAEVRAADLDTSGKKPEQNTEAEKGWLSNVLGDIARPAFALASLPIEFVIGTARSVVADITTDDPRYDLGFAPGAEQTPSPFEQTTGGQFIKGIFDENLTTDMGEGYVPRGDVHARQVQATRSAAPLVFNHAWTIGRGVGSLFFDDGESLMYRSLSGFIDLTANVILDPFVLAGKTNATVRALRRDIAEQYRRELGLETEGRLLERELFKYEEFARYFANKTEVVSRATLDHATEVAREMHRLAAEARRSPLAVMDPQVVANAALRRDQLADAEDLAASLVRPAAAREAEAIASRRELLRTTEEITETERATALGELEARAARGGVSASDEQKMLDSINNLEGLLGPEGLDAMTAKVVADSPNLPGVFTDAEPLVARSRALPGSEDGVDAIVHFDAELGPRAIVSVDDPVVDPEQMIASLRRTVRGKSNERSRAVDRIIAMLGQPDVSYADVLREAVEHSVGAPVLIALRESDVEGVTDIFRLTGGEGGVWWTTDEMTTAHWYSGNWVMRDLTPAGRTETRTLLTNQRRAADAEVRAVRKQQHQAERYADMLATAHTQVVDRLTSVSDSYEAVRFAVENAFGVRPRLGTNPHIDYGLLKEALFNPANTFDAAVGATGQIPDWMRAGELANRSMVAMATLGASEVARAARRFGVQPFLARSRQRVLDEMVALSDEPESLGRLHRLTNGKLDPALMHAIMRADTEEKVLEVLAPALGIGITGPIGPGWLGAQRLRLNAVNGGRGVDRVFNRAIRWVERSAAVSPRLGAYMNLADPSGSADTLRNYLTALPVVSMSTIDTAVGNFLAQTTEVGRGQAVRRAMDTVADELAAYHAAKSRWDPQTIELLNAAVKNATRVHEGGRAKVTDWWLGKYAADANIGYMTLGGQLIHLTGPQLESELARGGMVLPHIGELRDAMGRWGLAIQKVPGLRQARDVLDYGMDYWRSAVLFRFAYTLRNIGEMQFRMFLTGHSSIFNDPLGALAMASAMNPRNRTNRGLFAAFARYNKTATGRELGDVTGMDLDRYEDTLAEYIKIMTRHSSHHDMRTMRAMESSHNVRDVGVDQPGFNLGWAEQLIALNASELARIVAGYNPAAVRTAMRRGVDRDSAVVDWLLNSQQAARIRNDYLEAGESYAKIFTDPMALRQFLFDSPASIRARVMEYSANDEDLIRFIATGVLTRNDQALFSMSTRHPDPEVRQTLIQRRANNLAATLEPFKETLTVDRLRMRVRNSTRTPKGMADRMFDWFFEWNGRKENAWAMGPEFAYAFNDSVAGLMRAMTPEARQQAWEFIQAAEKRFRPHSEVFVRAREAMKAPGGSLTMADVEKVASRQASEHVKRMFYDARSRNMIYHQMRLVTPFAQPFVNTLWSWGRMMAERPYNVQKIGRLATGLSEPGSGVIYDIFDAIDPFTDRQSRDPTQGFIYTDPTSGEQMFSFPLIGSVLGAVFSPLAGANMAEAQQLRAPVSGLNLAFQGDIDFLPGVGPLLSIPLSVLMPDDAFGSVPEFIRDWAFPYGEPQLEAGLVETVLLPSWARRLWGALVNENFRAYSYKGVLAYYISTGEFPGLASDPEMQQKLIDEIQGTSKIMTVIRAFGAAVLPAAPSQEIYAADKDGNMIGVTYLADYFNHVSQEVDGDFDRAVKVFIDTYGEQALGAIVPSTTGDVSMSGPAWEFYKKHASEAGAYGDVLGAFFPGDYSYEAGQWQAERGDRVRLTPEQRVEKVLEFLYGAEERQLEGRAAREEWSTEDLDAAKEELRRKYGGAAPRFTGVTSADRLDQIRNALDHFDDLRETRAGQGALLLFEAYERWSDEAEFRTGQSLAARGSVREREQFLDEIDLIAEQFGGRNVPDGSVETIAGYFQNVVTPRGS